MRYEMLAIVEALQEAEEAGAPVEHIHFWIAWLCQEGSVESFEDWRMYWLDYRNRLTQRQLPG